MGIRVQALSQPYAIATGQAIAARMKEHGKVPAVIKSEFTAWQEAQAGLESAGTEEAADARELRSALGRAVSLPANVCRAITSAYANPVVPLTPAQTARAHAAALVGGVFGDNLQDIIGLPYREEWNQVREILVTLGDGPHKAAIATLGIVPDVALLAALHDAFGQSLGIAATTTATGAEAKKTAIADWNTSFSALAIAANYLSTHDHPELSGLILEPYATQVAAERDANRRHKQAAVAAAAAAAAAKPAAPAKPPDA